MIVEAEQTGTGPRRQVGVMVKLSKTPGTICSPGPEQGQDTPAILEELGYGDAEIESLRRAEAIA